MDRLKLGVIFGSRSCEHEISIISAVQLMRAVDSEVYEVIPVYISRKGEWYTGVPLFDMQTFIPFEEDRKDLTKVALDLTAGSGALTAIEPATGLFGKDRQRLIARLDCVIPVMHGAHGEDGSLQGVFELCNIPYACSGVGSSAIGMDKVFMKQFFRGEWFPVLPGCWFLRSAWEADAGTVIEEIERELSYPVFVKPASLGSSIGVGRAMTRRELEEAMATAFEFDRKVLVEKGIHNPLELNCSVLGYNGEAEASEIEMPITRGDLLSFFDKYSNNSAKGMASLKRMLPAPIDPKLHREIQELSVKIFRNLDCKGVVRIDYMFSPADGRIYITEINTIPGSLAFYLWEPSALSYTSLIDRMVRYALKAQQEKDHNSYAYTSDILKRLALGGKAGIKTPSGNPQAAKGAI